METIPIDWERLSVAAVCVRMCASICMCVCVGVCVRVYVCVYVCPCYCIVPTIGSFNLNRRYTIGWWDVVLAKWCPQITELSCRERMERGK